MVGSYLLHKGIANVDVHYCFMAGDLVLHLACREGKQSPRAWGPYTFVRYGATHTTAEVCNKATGKLGVVSAAELRPMLPERAVQMRRYPLL